MSWGKNLTDIICSKYLNFNAKHNNNNKISNYTIVFKISLISKSPLELPITCILLKKPKDKKHPYKEIAFKNFIVRQDNNTNYLNDLMYKGDFKETKLPDLKQIQGFISGAVPNSTYSALLTTDSPGSDMCCLTVGETCYETGC
jgi:hypothetical protein